MGQGMWRLERDEGGVLEVTGCPGKFEKVLKNLKKS